MRFRRVALPVVIFTLAIPIGAQVAPQRDPQAVAVLNQTLAVTGWASPPNDVVAQATVTQFKGDERVVQTVTWKARGPYALRIEVDAPDGRVTTVRNGSRGILTRGTQSGRLTGHAAATMHSIQFPFYPVMAAASEPSAQTTFRGTESVNGEEAHVIELRSRENPDNSDSPISQTGRFVLYISTGTLLPLKLDYVRLGGDNSNVVLRCSRLFSDYRRVDGILIPFHQSDLIRGQKVAEIQFTQVQLNPGVSSTEFDVPL